MMYRLQIKWAAPLFFASVLGVGALGVFFSSPKAIREYTEVAIEPRISPDYSDITIPANIAPINFKILEQGQYYFVKIHTDSSEPIRLFKSSQIVQTKAWGGEAL